MVKAQTYIFKKIKKKSFFSQQNTVVLFCPPRFRKSIKSFVILTPLLGLTWVFGLLAVTDAGLVFQYIFTVLNSTQVCISLFTTLAAVSVMSKHQTGSRCRRIPYKKTHLFKPPFFLYYTPKMLSGWECTGNPVTITTVSIVE